MSVAGTLWLLGCSLAVVLANVILRISIQRSGVEIFADGLSALPSDIFRLLLEPRFPFAIACYGVAMLIWFRLLATEPLGIVYPMLACLTFVGVSLAGAFAFSESLGPWKIIGLGLMVAGLLVLSHGQG